MAQQTRRAPGRPKKVQIPAVESVEAVMEAPKAAPKKKKLPIKRKEEVTVHSEYEIQRGAGVVYMLPQKGITVYDEANDTVREVRYCPNEPSIMSMSRATTPSRSPLYLGRDACSCQRTSPT